MPGRGGAGKKGGKKRRRRKVTKVLKAPTVPRVTKNWRRDSAAKTCMHAGCLRDFGVLIRRHHCRNCGDIFCGAHSTKRFNMKDDTDAVKAVRVCDVCHEKLTRKHGAARVVVGATGAAASTAPPAYNDLW
jgi:hypothetical protein